MWTTLRRIAENLAGVFLGVLVTIALRHDLFLGCTLGLIVCLAVIFVCARFESRLKRNESAQGGLNITAKGVVSKPDLSDWVVTYDGELVPRPPAPAPTTIRDNIVHEGPGGGTGIHVEGGEGVEISGNLVSGFRNGIVRKSGDLPATPNPPPDFEPERREYREIMINCDGNGQVWEPVIHSLIVRTRAKIEAWNPRHVARFDDPDTSDMILSQMDDMAYPNEIPSLRDLRQRFERLDRILGL